MTSPDLLQSLRFLQDVSGEHLSHIGQIAEVREVADSFVLFREGDTPAYVYLILEGRVSLEICVAGKGCKRIQTFGRGELVGWSPLLQSGPMTATARAMGPCQLVALHAHQLLALCTKSPSLGMELMRRTALALAQRLNATRLQLLDIYRQELPVVDDRGGPA